MHRTGFELPWICKSQLRDLICTGNPMRVCKSQQLRSILRSASITRAPRHSRCRNYALRFGFAIPAKAATIFGFTNNQIGISCLRSDPLEAFRRGLFDIVNRPTPRGLPPTRCCARAGAGKFPQKIPSAEGITGNFGRRRSSRFLYTKRDSVYRNSVMFRPHVAGRRAGHLAPVVRISGEAVDVGHRYC